MAPRAAVNYPCESCRGDILKSSLWFCLIAGWSLIISACGSSIIFDDFGPPAGYTEITGTVRTSTGTPVALIEVSFSRCREPSHFGVSPMGITNAEGVYRARGHLAPVGAFRSDFNVDTLVVTCEVFVGRPPTTRDIATAWDTIQLRFVSLEANVVPLKLDLTLP